MISRTLVPRDVKPATAEDLKRSASRVTTYMDDRIVVPSGKSDAPPLDGKTNIPVHMPLGVLVDTTLVPRDLPIKHMERSQVSQEHGAMALEVLDSRTVVPARVNPLAQKEREEFARPRDVTPELREVVEPDIFMTGDANLLIESEEKHDSKWDNLSRIGSIIAHIALILFLINIPRIFKTTEPTAEDIALAQKELPFVYLPPTTPSPRPPTPKMPKLDPNMLRKMAPPVERPLLPEPTPPPTTPQPVKPAPELPEAPTPHTITPTQPPPPTPQPVQPPPSALEPIKPQPNHLNLQVNNASPGELLRQQEEDALKRQNQGGPSYSTSGRVPGGGAGAQGPSANAQVSILSPTEGVNFNPYIERMLDTIRRNWYAIMPQSAMLGDKGVVYVTFTINPDGSIQVQDPELQRTSQKEPLDKAAMSSIRASNPFAPLPQEFHGPSMKFGIVFLYNVPIESLGH